MNRLVLALAALFIAEPAYAQYVPPQAVNLAASGSGGVWGVLGGANGGIGVNNGASTLTLGGSLTTTGSSAETLAFPGSPQTTTFPANNGTVAELNLAQTWTAAQTFTNSDLLLLGSSTGATTFTSANAGASNYTATIPANTGTVAELNLAQAWTAAQSFTNTSAPSLSNGAAGIWASATNGALFGGQGSTNDVEIVNNAGAAAIKVPTGTTNVTIGGNLTVSGATPTSCSATSAGSGSSCAFSTGSVNSNGKILITAGSAASSSGSFTITPSSAVGTNVTTCTFTLSDAGTAWASTAGVHDSTASNSSFTGNWYNGGASLTNTSVYHITYHCHGK